jgi:hypothetical protein
MKDLKIRGVIRKSYKTQGKQICSWRGLIASEDGGRDEPATAARWPAAHGLVGAGDGGSGARQLEQGLGHAAHGLHVL